MNALTHGAHAPQFSLALADSAKIFTLNAALQRGPALLAFFKISCPVCQLTFPFLERLYRAYGDGKFTLAGISQDSAAQTLEFAERYGVTFPIAVDAAGKYPVSNAYGLTNVPTLFWISPSGTIELTSAGWVKADFEKLNEFAAVTSGVPSKLLIHAEEKIPDYKPG